MTMGGVAPTGSGTDPSGAISGMTNAFNQAIQESAKITELETTKNTALDASKQRPQNG
ncbi:MAG TPA: hypothetical protein VF286_11080 [Acidiphilium sp.]